MEKYITIMYPSKAGYQFGDEELEIMTKEEIIEEFRIDEEAFEGGEYCDENYGAEFDEPDERTYVWYTYDEYYKMKKEELEALNNSFEREMLELKNEIEKEIE